MRIQFLKEVSVRLENLPTTAWGRVQIRYSNAAPTVDESGQFTMPASEAGYVFPVQAIVNLPDELAQRYIADGVAELNESPNGAFAGEWPEDLKPEGTPCIG